MTVPSELASIMAEQEFGPRSCRSKSIILTTTMALACLLACGTKAQKLHTHSGCVVLVQEMQLSPSVVVEGWIGLISSESTEPHRPAPIIGMFRIFNIKRNKLLDTSKELKTIVTGLKGSHQRHISKHSLRKATCWDE